MSQFEGKTEKPTPKRKRQARSEGQIARSQEVGTALSLSAALLWAWTILPGMGRYLGDGMRRILGSSGTASLHDVVRAEVPGMLAVSIAPLLGLVFVMALAGGLAQTGLALTPKALKPKFKNMSPKKNLERFKPARMGWEAARALLKLGLLVAVSYGPIRRIVDAGTAGRGLGSWLQLIGTSAMQILAGVVIVALCVAAADFAVNILRHAKQLKMSRKEVRDEHKQTEGDPLVKAQRRRRHIEMSRNRMISDVTTADVLVTNPTHFAVALKYSPGEPAPRVVAKGMDLLAQELRKTAYRHGVLVRSDPPLARTLYRRCKVGSYVPQALYEAVAVLIAVAYRRRHAGVA